MSLNKTTVLLVDDHELVRAGFRRLLEDGDKLTVIAEAGSGEQAVQDYAKYKPDVVVMDISMPGIGGIGAIERIIARDPEAQILVLSVHEDGVFTTRALKAGAKGFIPKRSAPEEMIRAVEAGYMESRYPTLKPIYEQFKIKNLDIYRDPLGSSGVTKFVYTVNRLALLHLKSKLNMSSVKKRFTQTYGHMEETPRFINLAFEGSIDKYL